MRRYTSPWLTSVVLAPALAMWIGCSQTQQSRSKERSPAQLPNSGSPAKVTQRQAADVQIALGRTLEQSDRLAEAEKIYQEALNRDPHRGDAHARLAVLSDRKGDFKASAHHFAEAVRLDPRNPEIHCDQGYSFYVQRRWAEAEASLRKAIALDARHARSHNNLGLVLARHGNTEGALAEFTRAGCDSSDARANLGLILAMEGQFSDSKTAYAKALELKPTSAIAIEGLHAASVAVSSDQSSIARGEERSGKKDMGLLRTSLESVR